MAHVQYMWVGATTESTATVRGRLTVAATDVRLLVREDGSDESFIGAHVLVFGPVSPTADSAFTLEAVGLDADTRWHYAIQVDSTIDATRGQFRTHPPLGEPAVFTIAAASCAGGGPRFPGVGGELAGFRISNHPVFDRIREADPLMFLHNGDLHYYDLGSGEHGITGGGSLANYRRSFDDVLAQPRQHELYRNVATAYLPDDHDRGPNDHDSTYADGANFETAYRERVPHYALPDANGAVYQSWQIARTLFIGFDVRNARDPNTDPDGAAKTMLGAAQKVWLDNLLATSGAEFLVWLMPDEWLGLRRDSWNVFQTERDELVQMLGDRGWLNKMCLLQGDIHELSIDTGSHRWGGFPVYTFAALDSSVLAQQFQYDTGPSSRGHGRFGTLRVDDRGHRIYVTGTGWIGRWEWKTHAFNVSTTTPAPPPPEVQTIDAVATLRMPDGNEVVELERWSVDREIATSLPDEVQLVSGISAARAVFDAPAPEGTNPGWWSPWLRRRRTVGRLAVLDVTINDVTSRVFTGLVVEASADAEAQVVRLEQLDDATLLRAEVGLPAFTAEMGGDRNPGIHLVWLLEHILRELGNPGSEHPDHQHTPLPQTGTNPLLIASLAGSAIPSLGQYLRTITPLNAVPNFEDRGDLPVPAFVDSDVVYEFGRPPFPLPTTVVVGAVVGDTTVPSSGETRVTLELASLAQVVVVWLVEPTHNTVRIRTTSGQDITADAIDTLDFEDVDLGLTWVELTHNPPNIDVTVYQHNTVVGTGSVSVNHATWDTPQLNRVGVLSLDSAPIVGVQVLDWDPPTAADLPTMNMTMFDQISPLMGQLVGIPPLERADGIDILRDVAEAEQAGVWFDEGGHPVLHNRARLRGVEVDEIEVTSHDSLLGFRWRETVEQTATAVEASVAVPTAAFQDPPADVWTADGVFQPGALRVNGGKTFEFVAELDVGVSGLETVLSGTANSGSRYRANRQHDGTGGVVLLGGPTARQLAPDRVLVRVVNPHSFPVWLVNGPGALQGEPAIVLAATTTVQAGETAAIRREVDGEGSITHVLKLSDNVWRQNVGATERLVRFLANNFATPSPVAQQVKIVPNLDVKLGSVVRLRDPEISGLEVRALVHSVRLSGAPGALEQTIEVQPLPPTMFEHDQLLAGLTLGDHDVAFAGQRLRDHDVNPIHEPLEI